MSTPIPPSIVEFIQQHHVVSITACHEQQCWAASCFYAFDEARQRLILLTKSSTRHGQLMQKNPRIVGTIAGQPTHIREIEGIQFSATATLLTKKQDQLPACECYYQRHPAGKLIPSEVWEIKLDYIKHTSNKAIFAQKTEWHRNEKAAS